MMKEFKTPLKTLACPNCHRYFIVKAGKLICKHCDFVFDANQYGFFDFVFDQNVSEVDTTTEEYVEIQELNGARVYNEYLKPFLLQEPSNRILDVGCGVGIIISMLIKDGYDAYGIDLPSLAKFWVKLGNDSQHFFCGDATQLPFPDNFFDVVFSLGVIEHIGTKIGHCTLSDNYLEARQQYANEILRVTKPGGRILISCPNKSFPIDVQHGPRDRLSPESKIRSYICEKTGMNIHRTLGRYHLLSYAETKKLFCDKGGARYFEALPLKGYFSFGRFKSGFLKTFTKLTTIYINNLPRFLRSSFLNPYVLVQIKK